MPVVPGYWSPAIPVSKDDLVDRVLSPMGFIQGEDTEADNTALAHLNAAINDLNTRLWEFNKRVATGETITASQQYVDLPSGIHKVNFVQLVKTSDGVQENPMQYVDWVDYVRMTATVNTDDGIPTSYSHRNLDNEGRIYFWPIPDSTTASDYTLTYEYYRRIPLASEEDPLQIPREVQNAIVYAARSTFLLDHNDENRSRLYKALAMEALKDAINGDRVQPDEAKAFKVVDFKPGVDPYRTKWHLHV